MAAAGEDPFPVDPDVPAPDADDPPSVPAGRGRAGRRPGLLRRRWDVLLVIAAGGAIGSAARWGAGVLLPTAPGAVPWATFLVNVTGAFALGLLMHFVVEVWSPSRYVRPFLGVGVLGGYTTFSTYMVETRGLLAGGHWAIGLGYLLGTLAVGLPAVLAGLAAGRVIAAGGRRTP